MIIVCSTYRITAGIAFSLILQYTIMLLLYYYFRFVRALKTNDWYDLIFFFWSLYDIFIFAIKFTDDIWYRIIFWLLHASAKI